MHSIITFFNNEGYNKTTLKQASWVSKYSSSLLTAIIKPVSPLFYEGNNKFLSSPWQRVSVGRFLNWKIIGLCSTWTNKLCVGLKISCLSSNSNHWRLISPSWLLIDSFKRSEINWSIKLLNNKAIKQEFQSCYTHTQLHLWKPPIGFIRN